MDKVWLIISALVMVMCIIVSEYKIEGTKEEVKISEAKEEVKSIYNPIKNHTVKAYNPEKEEQIEEVTDRKTIALLGSDTRIEDGDGRSDAIIVLQLDPDMDRIQYVSVPRDTYTEIVGKGYKDKINHAMVYGADYTVASLENLLKVKIDNYFTIDFHSFERIIDEIGGVDVVVEKGFSEQNKAGKQRAVRINSGEQTLTGEQALAYARMRKQDAEGDLGRAKRQQQIIESTMNKLSETDTFLKLKLAKYILGELDSNFEISEIPSYIKYIKKYKNTEKIVLSGKGINIGGVYYLELDDTILKEAQSVLKGKPLEKEIEISTAVDNKYDITHKQH